MNQAQQELLKQFLNRDSSNYNEDEDELVNSENETQKEMLARFLKQNESDEDSKPESRSLGLLAHDVAVGMTAAVPRAVGGLVSLGSLIPGVNVVTDPIAEALMTAGDWVEDTLISDYQKNINEDMAKAMANSARELGPNASIGDHLKNIASQGGAAAEFVAKNPSEALMLA